MAKKTRNIISPDKEIVVLGDTTHSVGNFSRKYYVPDISLAKNELSLDIWIDLDLSIKRLYNSNLQNG